MDLSAPARRSAGVDLDSGWGGCARDGGRLPAWLFAPSPFRSGDHGGLPALGLPRGAARLLDRGRLAPVDARSPAAHLPHAAAPPLDDSRGAALLAGQRQGRVPARPPAGLPQRGRIRAAALQRGPADRADVDASDRVLDDWHRDRDRLARPAGARVGDAIPGLAPAPATHLLRRRPSVLVARAHPSTQPRPLDVLLRSALLFLGTLPCDALSAFLCFCGRVVYPSHAAAPAVFGLTPLLDQECAGALMWFWVTIAYLLPAVAATLRTLSPSAPANANLIAQACILHRVGS